MRSLRKSIRTVSQLTQRVRDIIPEDVDRLAGLSPKARAICEDYIKTASPERKYLDLMNGQYPLPDLPREPVIIKPNQDAQKIMADAWRGELERSAQIFEMQKMFARLQKAVS